MASSVDNVKLGVCTIWYDGTDLGYTKGGVEVEVQTSTHEVKVDQFGETPVSELITGRTISVKVPLAETTLENLVAIMPGSELVSDGAKASGTVTFSTAAPANGDKVAIGTHEFTFKTSPSAANDMPIPTTIAQAATLLADKISYASIGYKTQAAGGVVTITAISSGTAGNAAVTKTGSNIAVTNIAGGVNSTMAAVKVKSGININLLSTAKTLVLRPIGTNGDDDLTVHRVACPGALNFAYQTDNERVYQADFKGYAQDDGSLFSIGDQQALTMP